MTIKKGETYTLDFSFYNSIEVKVTGFRDTLLGRRVYFEHDNGCGFMRKTSMFEFLFRYNIIK